MIAVRTGSRSGAVATATDFTAMVSCLNAGDSASATAGSGLTE